MPIWSIGRDDPHCAGSRRRALLIATRHLIVGPRFLLAVAGGHLSVPSIGKENAWECNDAGRYYHGCRDGINGFEHKPVSVLSRLPDSALSNKKSPNLSARA